MLTTEDAAQLLGVSPRTLEAWRLHTPPKGPEFIRIEGQVRYAQASLEDYLTASFNKPAALPRSTSLTAQQTNPITEPTALPWAQLHKELA